jgi:hypothetical protein
MEGAAISYTCPRVAPTAQCLWYDSATAAWSNADTAVVAQTATSVTCSTLRLAPHALRYASLPQTQDDIFATQAPLTQSSSTTLNPASMVLVGLAAVGFLGAALTHRRARLAAKFAHALEASAAVAVLRAAWGSGAARGGAAWVVDASSEGRGGGRGGSWPRWRPRRCPARSPLAPSTPPAPRWCP